MAGVLKWTIFSRRPVIANVTPVNIVHHFSFDLLGGERLTVVDDVQFGLESADNTCSYDAIHHIPSRAARSYVTKRGVTVTRIDDSTKSCLLAFPSGGAMRATNVMVHRTRLFVASGVALAAIDVPELSVAWTVDLLSGADNGLHNYADDCILAIGDYDATLLEWSGSIRWTTNIPGCLVAPGTVSGDTLSIDDDDSQTHCLDLTNGKIVRGNNGLNTERRWRAF